MCLGQIGETSDNTRLILQLAQARNETLASYIRLTDGAVWGFLGIAAINLLGNQKFLPTKLSLFLILLIISMSFWRLQVKNYQKDIVKGYNRIVNCENYLDIPYDITVRKNLEDTIEKDTGSRPQSVSELLTALTPENYNDVHHVKLNFYAFLIGLFGFLVLICFGFEWIPIIGFLGLVVLILWCFKWLSFLKILTTEV